VATHQDLLDAIARVRTATGDPDGWTAGLSGYDVAVATNPLSTPAALGAVLAKVVAAHPDVFRSSASDQSAGAAGVEGEQQARGEAAEAIRGAETRLTEQQSAAAQVDRRVLSAALDAHAGHADGLAALDRLQREIEDAAARTDLGTPAGARTFQQYLIGRLRDIRAVVEKAGLNSGSEATLAAALAVVYAEVIAESAAEERSSPKSADDDRDPERERERDDGRAGEGAGERGARVPLGSLDSLGWEPDPWATLGDDLGPAPLPETAAPAMAAGPAGPVGSALAAPPTGWGGGVPAGGALAGGPAGGPFGGPLGGGMSAPTIPALPDFRPDPWIAPTGDPESDPDEVAEQFPGEVAEEADPDPDTDPDESDGEQSVDEATIVQLPDGETVAAPSPELAAVITAAVAGSPIPEAFRQQGISIPEPGTPVIGPLAEQQLLPGDIGVFADRHALALGNGTALLDQQIGPLTDVAGPDFLGWQHPPAPQSEPLPDTPALVPSAQTAPS